MFRLKEIVAVEVKVASVISMLKSGNRLPLLRSISSPLVIVLTYSSCSARAFIYLNIVLYAFIIIVLRLVFLVAPPFSAYLIYELGICETRVP